MPKTPVLPLTPLGIERSFILTASLSAVTTWTTVGIPSAGVCDLLHQLIAELVEQDEFDDFLLIDNTETGTVLEEYGGHPRLMVTHRPTLTLTQMWNAMWAHSKVRGTGRGMDSQIVLLNDDVRIPKHFVSRLVDVLRSDERIACAYPNYRLPLDQDCPVNNGWTATEGTYKDGGLWGCAFAIRGEILNIKIPPMDEQFDFWCSDDDLVEQIKRAGLLTVRADDIALEHEASSSYVQIDGLPQRGFEDVERFKAKYGRW